MVVGNKKIRIHEMRLLKGVGKFKVSLKANMRQRFSSNPALYHLQATGILTAICLFFLT